MTTSKTPPVLYYLALIFSATGILLVGIGIGRGGSPLALIARPTLTLTPTSTPTHTLTPPATVTPTSTPTEMPTRTPAPTPTLLPGQIPLSVAGIRGNYSEMWDINCQDIGPDAEGGYYWECRAKDGNNIVRTIFYGPDSETVTYLLAYVMNIYDPSPYQAATYFSDISWAVFENETGSLIGIWAWDSLPDLSGLGDQVFQQEIDGYTVSLSGPGVCRLLQVGDPGFKVDIGVVPVLSELEAFCGLGDFSTPAP